MIRGRDIALQRILNGTLRVIEHPDIGIRIEGYHTKRKQWYRIRQHLHKKDGRYRIVLGKKRQPVYLNVLVYIWNNKKLPDGFIDHKNGNKQDDRSNNIKEHLEYESNKQGNDIQFNNRLNRILQYFDDIIEWGHPL